MPTQRSYKNYTPQIRYEIPDEFPAQWACAWGEDERGIWQEFQVKGVKQRMRWIWPGTFVMGSPKDDAERLENETQHEVTLSHGYWLADTACTKELWQAVMESVPDEEGKAPGRHHPVVNISWEGIQEFLRNLDGLVPELKPCLPTEAQWEHACRAGTTTPFWWGETLTKDNANYDGNGTVPVKKFERNPWGLYQMHGNVWEWCDDRYGEYSTEPIKDPPGPKSGAIRVLRGGSWSLIGRLLRSAYRLRDVPSDRYHNRGFRLSRGHQAGQGQGLAEQGGSG